MAFSISAIKAKTEAKFARPNLFRVQMVKGVEVSEEILRINCYNVQVPGLSMATTNKDQGYRSVAYQKIYDDITLSFYCSESMAELKYLQGWMDSIVSPETNHVQYYDNYKGQLIITNLTSQENDDAEDDSNFKSLTTLVYEAFPKQISPIQLDYGTTNQVLSVQATFTYRYYRQQWHDEKTRPRFLAKNLSADEIKKDQGLIDRTLSKTQRKSLFDGTVNEGSDDLEF